MERYVKASAFLDDQIAPPLRSLIPPTLRLAYAAADELAKDQPILGVESARSNRGRLRSWACDFAFEKLIQTGRWPYDYDWAPFAQPTGKYLRIRLESSVMSISLVPDPKCPPRHVKFRANNALGNPYPFLFEEMNQEEEIKGLPSFVLVHGHREPEFAHIGMPHPQNRAWLYVTPNLFHLPHVVEAANPNLPPVEAENKDAIVTLKDEIRKWQRDNKNE